jgi:hypothetical protein
VRRILRWGMVVSTAAALGAAAWFYLARTLKIADHASVNVPLPGDFTRRLIYADSAAIRDHIGDLAGRIITFGPAGVARKASERLLAQVPPPPLEQIADGLVYESKIDQQASVAAKGTYLATLSGAFSGSNMLEVTITDVASVRLNDDQIDWHRLRQLAATMTDATETSSCFVQGVRLAMVTYRAYVKSDSKSGMAYGDVFAFDGSVYSSSQKHTVDYAVSVDCISMAVIKQIAQRTGLSPLPEPLSEARAVSAMRSLVVNRTITHGEVSGQRLGALIRFGGYE